jgi:hypothetical protein
VIILYWKTRWSTFPISGAEPYCCRHYCATAKSDYLVEYSDRPLLRDKQAERQMMYLKGIQSLTTRTTWSLKRNGHEMRPSRLENSLPGCDASLEPKPRAQPAENFVTPEAFSPAGLMTMGALNKPSMPNLIMTICRIHCAREKIGEHIQTIVEPGMIWKQSAKL